MDAVVFHVDRFHQLAMMQQGRTIAQAAQHAHLVGNDDDGDIEAFVDVFQTTQHTAGGGGIQRRSGFIRQNHLRIRRQRTSDTHALFLPP